MQTTTIVPGLVVDNKLFEATAHGLATHVPEHEPLAWSTFTDSAGWTLVPDERGDGYKAELVLLNTMARTIKINLWFLADRRGGQQSQPYSHPWPFTAHILLGGYNEDRYTPNGASVLAQRGVEHREGDVNEVPRRIYHEATDIHDPSRTLTLMMCGPGQRGTWGYLDTSTGQHIPVQPDPEFTSRLKALNPHQC
ncbi:hypothetical protein ACFU99_14505 [Streptomyces sp. NPDC057654]|uniref:hypothetical protein n=1 Tax=Streptomyces sp. NPDC057654 TaxID=3346196 RepID=UPI003682482E